MWCSAGTPPTGLEWLGAVATERCWLLPCPACCVGWVPLAPGPGEYGYTLAVGVGCSAACGADAAELAWRHMWRNGTLPPRTAAEPAAWMKRYAERAVRGIWRDLPDPPSLAQLRRATFASGQWLQAGGLPDRLVERAVALAAQRAMVDLQTLAADLLAGRARPARLPAERRA
jgi:hypothetical protein